MRATPNQLLVTSSPAGLDIASEDGRVRISGIGASVEWSQAGSSSTWSPTRWVGGDADRVAKDGPRGLEMDLRVAVIDDGQAVELSVGVTNHGDRPIHVERIVVAESYRLEVGVDPRRWSVYRNGHQSWSGTRTYRSDERDADLPTAFLRASATDPVHRAPSGVGHIRSDTWSTVAEQESGDALGIGFVTTAAAFSYLELESAEGRRSHLRAWCDLDGVSVAPGEHLAAERLALVATRGPAAGESALSRILDRCGAAMSARLDGGHRGGWCSWYYYFQNVTEDDVLANLEVLATDGVGGPRFASSYVMIDDGHQSGIGDWLDTAATFPSGMEALADRIRSAGFDAGLWWAPFLCAADSRVARDHPEWLVRNARGRPLTPLVNPAWGGRLMRALDTTHPGVAEHLAAVSSTMVNEWGYEILKLDFLFAASMAGARHRRTTRAASLRAGLEAVRAGAGEGAFLLGCGCPLGPAVGLVDAMRIGADVSPVWEMPTAPIQRHLHGISTRNAIRNTLTRATMDGRLWDNDPDCLMVRATDTKLTLDEVRLLATVIGMTNGMIVVSDALADLGEDRVGIIGATRDLNGGTVEVVDLFDSDIPEVVVSRHAGHVDVALLNLDDQARPVSLDLDAVGVDSDRVTGATDFWTGRSMEMEGSLVRFGRVPRHSSTVVRFHH